MKRSWSSSKGGFLSLTSRLLALSERRLFRAVIGVSRAKQEQVSMGGVISFFVPTTERRFDSPSRPDYNT